MHFWWPKSSRRLPRLHCTLQWRLRLSLPQIPEVARAVGKLSYNQLVEKIITCKHSSDPNMVTEGDARSLDLKSWVVIARGGRSCNISKYIP